MTASDDDDDNDDDDDDDVIFLSQVKKVTMIKDLVLVRSSLQMGGRSTSQQGL